MNKEKNSSAKIAIVIEIILIIVFIWSYIDLNAECEDWSCLGKILPYLLIRITGILAIINLFIIQILRKKGLIFPIIVFLCIISIFFIKNYEKEKYIKTTRFEPENNFDSIFHNDFSKTNKYIYYFVHNNYLYYYKYDENYINFEEDEKGILFKTDFNLNKTDKVCELNSGMSFYFDFIYNNEVFYTTREKNCEECGLSYHNSLKRLNLDTCEEKNIIDYDETTRGEWEYILNSRNNDEILFYDYGKNDDKDMLYRYNIKENKIVKSGTVNDVFEYYGINDYNSFDSYSIKYDGVYLNDALLYKLDDFKIEKTNVELLDYDSENIYLFDSDYVYVLNKNLKQIISKKELTLKNIFKHNLFMNHYFSAENKMFKYNTEKNEFIYLDKFPSFDYNSDENISLADVYKINDYYLFSDADAISGSTEHYDNTDMVVLLVFDNTGKDIIKEYYNGNLINYFIDNDDIYLVYNDNTIKKIETKS